jgi:Na+-translocating ferredoxin:NAD+ oxidoreductase subunit E
MTARALAVFKDGLWTNNVTLSQKLALCPLLALTSTATNGLGMGLATTACLVMTNVAISLVRGVITPQVRIPAFILVIAGIVTLVDMLINAYGHELYKVLGLFIPLIVTNCVILGRAEAFASRNGPSLSACDALGIGLGFTMSLTGIGAIREILGSGTLFANASLMLGAPLAFLETTIIPDYKGFLLMILPPGGFLVLGFALAAKRVFDSRASRRAASVAAPASACH